MDEVYTEGLWTKSTQCNKELRAHFLTAVIVDAGWATDEVRFPAAVCNYLPTADEVDTTGMCRSDTGGPLWPRKKNVNALDSFLREGGKAAKGGRGFYNDNDAEPKCQRHS